MANHTNWKKGFEALRKAWDTNGAMGPNLRKNRYLKLSQKEAEAAGQGVYWTGKECVHGHIDFRYIKSHQCTVCARIAERKHQRKNAHNNMLDIDRLLEERRLAKEDYYED